MSLRIVWSSSIQLLLQGHWQAERNVPDVRLSSKINLSPYASIPEINSSQRQVSQAEQVHLACMHATVVAFLVKTVQKFCAGRF